VVCDNLRIAVVSFFAAGAVFGCGRADVPPAPPTTVVATLRAVDLDDKPLKGMIPIATRGANAFDEPLVRGEPSKIDGTSVLSIPSDQHLFLRMWDPVLKYFANNFYEIVPGARNIPATMTVTMVPGASLDMIVPALNATVDIMMIHPAEGPWWPARATSDAAGHVHFDAVPAGVYAVRVTAQSGGTADLGEVKLQPSGALDLGRVPLDREEPDGK